MKSIFIGVLGIYFLIVCFSNAAPVLEFMSPLVLKESPKCDLRSKVDFANLLEKYNDCNTTVSFYKQMNYFAIREQALCFGMYDAIYRLCEVSDKLDKGVEKYNVTNDICKINSSTFQMPKFKYEDSRLFNLSEAFHSIMMNKEKCESLCVTNSDVNPRCVVAMNALRLLNKTSEATNKLTNGTKEAAPQPHVEMNQFDGGVGKESIPKSPFSIGINVSKAIIENLQESAPNSTTLSMSKLPSSPAEQQPKNYETSIVLKDDKIKNNLDDEVEKKPPEELEANEESEGHFKPADDTDDLNTQQTDSPEENDDNGNKVDSNAKIETKKTDIDLPTGINGHFAETEDSNFFTYFIVMTSVCIIAYVFFHNKNKLLALALEGRKVRSSRGKGRHSSTSYSKLHSNLEEAIASNTTSPSSIHVLY